MNEYLGKVIEKYYKEDEDVDMVALREYLRDNVIEYAKMSDLEIDLLIEKHLFPLLKIIYKK